ncbi:LPS assembly protein LptD [uncultured Thiocystis sp.]|jgi:LPS-assembly protein|uniref:LPS-assembly protein LptD n=1 Tax=uncultured Thiocystis sp. TaxID=1202134 RepID=UPI0025D2BC5D|nr:LPS assembly protein LptD [uncultured Thiocystis sp.]
MADLRCGARAAALPILIALSTSAFSEVPSPASAAPCPDLSSRAGDDCQPPSGPHEAAAPVSAQPPTPPNQSAAADEASRQSVPETRADLFVPSTIEPDRPSPTELLPNRPSSNESLTALRRHGPAGEDARLLLPRDTGESEGTNAPDIGLNQTIGAGDAQRQERRLHANLAWDYCGPRPGSSGIDSAAPLDGTNAMPIDMTADRVDGDQHTTLIQLQGDVEILQNDRRLEADRTTYHRGSGDIKAFGDLYLDFPGLRLTGNRAEYNLETKQGTIEQVRYRVSGNANLRGEATRAWMLSEQLSRYRNIIYTTCPPGHADWSIKASELELDQASGMGTARHARIRIADIPVLYSPYLSFPIDGRRRSGLLIPTFGSSDETGTDITLPYYWNIAPNLDATLIPRYMSTRGLMLGAQLRHLASFQELEVNAEVLPSDQKAPDQGARGALRVEQQGHFGTRWFSAVDYAAVSDDQYLQDFGNRLDVTSLRNLSRRGDLAYAGDGWRLLGRVQEFQTVDTSVAPADRPYGQLPHIELNLDPKHWKQLLEYRFESQYDYFDHRSAVHGNRLVAIPSVRIPLRRSFGHVIPRARLFYTDYDLIGQTEGLASRPSHLIPSFDLDGKLIFERETDWLGTPTLQTLEPRLYYVLTPFEDQSETPRFDTTALNFSFASLFRPNRFTGYDRIGDENRLTLGLTSRTIANRTGDELFRASIGQVYYFDHRRVQLTGDSVETDLSSSVAGELAARLHPDWAALASVQWNPHQTEQVWEKQILQLRYVPDEDRLLNLAYRYNLGTQAAEQYEDTDFSFQMPIGSHVKLVGRWLYSLLNHETVEAFAGLEFGRCCWRLRVLGQHLKRSSDNTGSTSVMLQLELAGLGSFGNRIDKLLERGIYGYQTD